jgi:hypothetical protein
LITLLAALSKAAQHEPRTIENQTCLVQLRVGSGFHTDPNAQIAPEMTPRVGGNNVNGRVNEM